MEMVLPKEGSGYEMEANALTKKGAKNPAAKQFLDWAITDEAMKLVRAVLRRGRGGRHARCPRACPRTSARSCIPNDFDWSAKNRDRILAEWQKRYAK